MVIKKTGDFPWTLPKRKRAIKTLDLETVLSQLDGSPTATKTGTTSQNVIREIAASGFQANNSKSSAGFVNSLGAFPVDTLAETSKELRKLSEQVRDLANIKAIHDTQDLKIANVIAHDVHDILNDTKRLTQLLEGVDSVAYARGTTVKVGLKNPDRDLFFKFKLDKNGSPDIKQQCKLQFELKNGEIINYKLPLENSESRVSLKDFILDRLKEEDYDRVLWKAIAQRFCKQLDQFQKTSKSPKDITELVIENLKANLFPSKNSSMKIFSFILKDFKNRKGFFKIEGVKGKGLFLSSHEFIDKALTLSRDPEYNNPATRQEVISNFIESTNEVLNELILFLKNNAIGDNDVVKEMEANFIEGLEAVVTTKDVEEIIEKPDEQNSSDIIPFEKKKEEQAPMETQSPSIFKKIISWGS